MKQRTSGTGRDGMEVDSPNPYFFIDTTPTPVFFAEAKQALDDVEGHKSKKRKSGDNYGGHIVETEDISGEVKAKLKLKGKKGGKRRRESEGSEKPAKKRKGNTTQKREHDGENGGGGSAKKRRRRKK